MSIELLLRCESKTSDGTAIIYILYIPEHNTGVTFGVQREYVCSKLSDDCFRNALTASDYTQY